MVMNKIIYEFAILVYMYVIAVYDVNQKRVAKMLKLCRRYLHWIQNSVFEGADQRGKTEGAQGSGSRYYAWK